MTYKAFAANDDGDPSYIGHIVDGHVELEVMGTVSEEGALSARSIALGPDGEPHVLAPHGVGHRWLEEERAAFEPTMTPADRRTTFGLKFPREV